MALAQHAVSLNVQHGPAVLGTSINLAAAASNAALAVLAPSNIYLAAQPQTQRVWIAARSMQSEGASALPALLTLAQV